MERLAFKSKEPEPRGHHYLTHEDEFYILKGTFAPLYGNTTQIGSYLMFNFMT